MQVARELEASPGPYQVWRAPRDGQDLSTNPPVFVWLPVAGVEQYLLQYSRDPVFPDAETVTVAVEGTTLYAPAEVFPPGRWYWRYGYESGSAWGVKFSRAREFRIGDKALQLPFPDVQKVIQGIGASHPRILVTPADLPGLRALGRGELRVELEALKRACEAYLGEPLPPEPPVLLAGPERARQYARTYQATRGLNAGATACAEAYLLSGEKQFGVEARRRLLHVISWDPEGATGLESNPEAAAEIVRVYPGVYDYVYDLLGDEQRHQCRRCFAARLPQVYDALLAIPFEVRPYEKAAVGHYVGDLLEASVALANEVDIARCLEYCLKLLWAPFYPPYGGEDGGWADGPFYWQWSTLGFCRALRLAHHITGLPVHQRPWLRNTGYFKLYSNPPYSRMSPFGDGQASPAGGGNTMWALATTFQDPYLAWYAQQMRYTPGGLGAFVAHGRQVAPKSPVSLKQGRCFADVGLACMHSDLADGKRNVHLMLRSSPFGSIGHSYANQNAFVLSAYGEPLAVSSGYQPFYGSPHHREWTWQTKASNSVGVGGEGQRVGDWHATGRIAQFHTDRYCHYARGEAPGAYRRRLRRFDRHVLYIRPLQPEMAPVIVIFDDLRTAPEVRGTPVLSTFQWYLHALEEIEVDHQAGEARIRQGAAGLEVSFLSPHDLSFHVTDQFSTPPEGDYPNQWHLTASTLEAAETCHFLTVLLPYADQAAADPRGARLFPLRGHIAAELVVRDLRHVIAFRTGASPQGAPLPQGLDPTADIAAATWDQAGGLLGSVALKRTG